MRTARTLVVVAAIISVLGTAAYFTQNPPTTTHPRTRLFSDRVYWETVTDYSALAQMLLVSIVVTAVWAGGLYYVLSLPGLIGPLCTGGLGVLGLLWGLGGRLTALLLIVAAVIAYKDYKRQAKATTEAPQQRGSE